MNFHKLFLGIFASAALLCTPIGRADDQAKVLTKTWEQWWQTRTVPVSISFTINPYSAYQYILAHPVASTISSGFLVALTMGLYIKYHRYCDWVAQKYKDIHDCIHEDLTNRTTRHSISLLVVAHNELKSEKLAKLIQAFYQALDTQSEAATATTASRASHNPGNPEDRARDIDLFLFGGNGNYTL